MMTQKHLMFMLCFVMFFTHTTQETHITLLQLARKEKERKDEINSLSNKWIHAGSQKKFSSGTSNKKSHQASNRRFKGT
jgi:hypothetical protein